MRRTLLAVAVMSPMVAAAYACQSDTFTGADASPEGGGGATQADFCDAEAQYLNSCGFGTQPCVVADLKNCGALYSSFSSGFATAIAHCMSIGQLPCSTETSKLLSSPCMSPQLAGYSNDGGALATLAKDYCDRCDKGNSACPGTFASAASDPGYLASFFSDAVIQQIDACEKTLDGGPKIIGDASVDCRGQTLICEYVGIGQSTPASSCSDQ